MRKLPVYVLLDCSESMAGNGIQAMREGVRSMLSALRQNPHALETAWISFIGFSSASRVLCKLTPLDEVAEPQLQLGHGTALGAALELLVDRINCEVKRGTVAAKGDFRPLVILLTDGQPTDDWRRAKALLDHTCGTSVANIYIIGCGQDVDYETLGQLSDIVFSSPEMTSDAMAKLFIWLTATVSSASIGATDGRDTSVVAIEKLPDSLIKLDLKKDTLPPRRRQVFISAVCSKTKLPYLMRYAESLDGNYQAVCSHPLNMESYDHSGSRQGGMLDSAALVGVPQCPFCEAHGAVCHGIPRCGVISCGGALDLKRMVHACPGCGEQFGVGSSGEFNVKTEMG